MLLLFHPDPPLLRWCKVDRGRFVPDEIPFSPGCLGAILNSVGGPDGIEAIGTLLVNGGEAITEPATVVAPGVLEQARTCVRLLPEQNDMAIRTAEYWSGSFPGIRQALLCDTAFFVGLPPEASTYAVPFALRNQGIKRYGGYGLCHQWTWQRTAEHFGDSVRRMVSVYLGDSPNLAAISDGHPMETTIGFTTIEGIPSARGCGDIDPTIVLQLASSGMSFEEISALLSRESGLTALAGRPCSYADLLQTNLAARVEEARDFLTYQITRSVGAFISVMGGIDALVFTGERVEGSMGIMAAVCRSLEPFGLEISIPVSAGGVLTGLTGPSSKIRAAALRFDRWTVYSEATNRLFQ